MKIGPNRYGALFIPRAAPPPQSSYENAIEPFRNLPDEIILEIMRYVLPKKQGIRRQEFDHFTKVELPVISAGSRRLARISKQAFCETNVFNLLDKHVFAALGPREALWCPPGEAKKWIRRVRFTLDWACHADDTNFARQAPEKDKCWKLLFQLCLYSFDCDLTHVEIRINIFWPTWWTVTSDGLDRLEEYAEKLYFIIKTTQLNIKVKLVSLRPVSVPILKAHRKEVKRVLASHENLEDWLEELFQEAITAIKK